MAPGDGLNRTSVGLKPTPPPAWVPSHRGLNRTSVGLKPGQIQTRRPRSTNRLNRTSVGLKHAYSPSLAGYSDSPQSNQRGIETPLFVLADIQAKTASIEPAWD